MVLRAGTAWMKVGMSGDGFPLGVFADLESAIKKVRPIKSQGFAIPFAILRIAKCRFCGNLLVTCRFILIFLVVSRKKRIFAIQFYGLYIWLD